MKKSYVDIEFAVFQHLKCYLKLKIVKFEEKIDKNWNGYHIIWSQEKSNLNNTHTEKLMSPFVSHWKISKIGGICFEKTCP